MALKYFENSLVWYIQSYNVQSFCRLSNFPPSNLLAELLMDLGNEEYYPLKETYQRVERGED